MRFSDSFDRTGLFARISIGRNNIDIFRHDLKKCKHLFGGTCRKSLLSTLQIIREIADAP